MRIAICGKGRAGKDTASRWLAENTYLRYKQSTSEAAAKIVYSATQTHMIETPSHLPLCDVRKVILRKYLPKKEYRSAQECWDDRHNHRLLWREVILEYNRPDGMRLYREMLGENDILNGIRDRNELIACKQAGLIDLTVWIAREVPNDPSINFHADLCDITIGNYRCLNEFPRSLAIKLLPILLNRAQAHLREAKDYLEMAMNYLSSIIDDLGA